MTRHCETEGCGKEAKMQCPTCIKNKLEPSYFCSQGCFKDSWSSHKVKHISLNTDPWPTFKYTGALRPHYPLSAWRAIPEDIPKPDYSLDGIPRSEQQLRGSTVITPITDPQDILKMRRACALGRLILDTAACRLKVGVTTDEIDRIVHDTTIKHGGYPSPYNYNGFPKSCCTSVNEIICHGIPDRRPLQDGDIINLDISVYLDGFHADLNETYCIGNVDDTARRLVDTTRECLYASIKQVKPGVRYRDLGETIEKIAKCQGFSVVRSYCGHGIHRLFHCLPNVAHYAQNKSIGIIRPGHIFTIEPMINEGVWKDFLWPDNWTSSTVDGKRSAQFEHTLLVTEDGVEILTERGIDKEYFPEEAAENQRLMAENESVNISSVVVVEKGS